MFSDRSEHFQQIQTFVPSLQGPCSSPVTLCSAVRTWQSFPDCCSSYILTRLSNCNWKRKFLPFFQKKWRAAYPPALYFRRFHTSLRFAKFGANGRVWLAWAATLHQLLPRRVRILQALLEGREGVPLHLSPGGWRPLGRKGCILDKPLDSVTSDKLIQKKSFTFTFQYWEKSMFLGLKTFRGSSVILVGKLKCRNQEATTIFFILN